MEYALCCVFVTATLNSRVILTTISDAMRQQHKIALLLPCPTHVLQKSSSSSPTHLHNLITEPVIFLLCCKQLKLLRLSSISQAVALRLQHLHFTCHI